MSHDNWTFRKPASDSDSLLPAASRYQRGGNTQQRGNSYYNDPVNYELDRSILGNRSILSDAPDGEKTLRQKIISSAIASTFFLAFVILAATVLGVSLFWSRTNAKAQVEATQCGNQCTYIVGESIPQDMNLTLADGNEYIYQLLIDMVNDARETIDIAAFYWSLQNNETAGNGQFGNELYAALRQAALQNGVKIRIAQSQPSPGQNDSFADPDSWQLAQDGLAEVVNVDFSKLFGSGVLHTKFIVVDRKHFFVGSANMDWRSFAQVKELGVAIYDCPCMALDLTKIWDMYYYLGTHLNSTLPPNGQYPQSFDTSINEQNRAVVNFIGSDSSAGGDVETGTLYLTSAPPQINPPGRSDDLKSIIDTIKNATEYINISVMDFVPAMLYGYPMQYWGAINDALLDAAINRNVTVNLLISKWNHTSPQMLQMLASLYVQGAVCEIQSTPWPCDGKINIQLFIVPDLPDGVVYPYTRVNHAKYMVTDKQTYIGTSNWTKDYFYTTAGVGLISTHPGLHQRVRDIFVRDWTSEYAHPLTEVFPALTQLVPATTTTTTTTTT